MANWCADFLTRNPDMAALPIALRSKHSIHFKRSARENIGQFVGAPCHFLDTDGLWKPLDTKLIAIGSEYGAPGLRTRLSKNGLVRVDGGTYSHISTRIGILDPTTKAFSAIKTIPNGLISGDQIIAETGVWKRVLTLTETGLREEIVISALPTGTGAGAGDWLVLETAISGVSFPDGWLTDFSADGFMFPPPRTHDANRNEANCKRYARTVGNIQYIYTGVPVSWLADAVYPVTIDPDYLGEAADGHIYGQNAVYATARSTKTGSENYGEYNLVGQNAIYQVFRPFLKFATSSLPDTATVSQANLTMVCTVDQSTTDFIIEIIEQHWASQDPLGTDDETAFDNCLSPTDHFDWKDTSSSFAINTPYASPNLTPGYVKRDGSTYYSLRSDRDKAATTPTTNEQTRLGAQEHATEAYRPILAVTYSAGGTSTANFFSMF